MKMAKTNGQRTKNGRGRGLASQGQGEASRGKPLATRRRQPEAGRTVQSMFPRLDGPRGRYGVGVLLAVAEGQGDRREVRFCRLESPSARPAQRPRAKLLETTNAGDVARIFTGLAHPDRVRIARAVLTGSNTHALLKETVGLKVGPIYHHLRELERAGLLCRLDRRGYALTDAGRDLLLLAGGLGKLVANGDRGRASWRVVRRRGANGKA